MTKFDELTEGFTITLNGINAEVYETADGVLITNNDFTPLDNYDELLMPYEDFKEQLINNNGNFKTNK